MASVQWPVPQMRVLKIMTRNTKQILDLLQVGAPSKKATLIIKNMTIRLARMGVDTTNKSEFMYTLAEKLELKNPKGPCLEAMRWAYKMARALAECE